MRQYRILAETFLPDGMLDWLDFKRVEVVEVDGKKVLHIYLDGNESFPDGREDLRPNDFTRESVFHDFPIRDKEVLLHVRRRRWQDSSGRNVMTSCDFIQEHTRCPKDPTAFLKDTFGDLPYSDPFT